MKEEKGDSSGKEKYYEKKLKELIRDIKREFPEFRIIDKKYSKFCMMQQRLAFWNKHYITRYCTTIGPVIYVNSGDDRYKSWKDTSARKKYATLLHERIHMRQTALCGGLIPFFFLYAFVPFPIKLAYFRKKWEQEGYEIGIYRALKEKGRKYVLGKEFVENLLEQFCGPFYMWTWYSRKAILKWLIRTVRDIEKGKLTWKILVNRHRRPYGTLKLRVPRIIKWLYPEEFALTAPGTEKSRTD